MVAADGVAVQVLEAGYYRRKDIGDIIINGGTVTATGGTNSAGIGNGYAGSVCTFSTGPDGNALLSHPAYCWIKPTKIIGAV